MFNTKKLFQIIMVMLFLFAENTQNCEKEINGITEDTHMKLLSSAFENGKRIPKKYTCEGQNISPPLEVQGVPSNTQSLAIIVEDPDTGHGTFDHWVAWNIPANTKVIDSQTIAGIQGKNGKGNSNYLGPCPPTGNHRYFFKIYALDTLLRLPKGSSKQELEEAIKGHIIAETQLMGTYSKEGK